MTQHIQTIDENGNPIGLPPQGVVTIPAATAIAWKAITPAADVVITFGSDTTEYTLPASTTILVHSTLRLKTETTCLVY